MSPQGRPKSRAEQVRAQTAGNALILVGVDSVSRILLVAYKAKHIPPLAAMFQMTRKLSHAPKACAQLITNA